ncbi:MAG: hypothetical protein D6800_07450 [Candidatus Zixiibacteriota bacterium]|nr:MAG: hypothetical protein D6800_07450 [candidate division Zixibacteria bacterium]
MTGVKDINASFGHNTYWGNVRLETGYASTRLGRRSYLHGSIRFAKIDQLEFRTAPTAQPTTFFDAHDVSFKSGIAWDLTDRITAGVAAGWFIEKIEAWRGSAFNVDLGAQMQATPQLRLGASATNLGGDLNLTVTGRTGARPISLPTTYRAGAAYQYDRYLGAVDLVVLDDELHVQVGAEAKLHDVITVRAGYMSNYDTRNVTAGLSLRHRNLTIDYAVVPFTDNLGTAHMFNFTFEL